MERVVDPLVLQRRRETNGSFVVGFAIMVALFAVLPFVAYPVFLMQVLCFALFACAFNLLIGYVGLVSFGHALYFGFAGYLSAYVAKYWHDQLSVLVRQTDVAVDSLAGPIPCFGGAGRHGDRRRARHHCRRHRHPPPGHLFRHDHAWRWRR